MKKMNEIPVWEFALGEDSTCLSKATKVHVPHTWSVDDQTHAVLGKGWYRTRLEIGQTAGERTFLRFRGAYRDTSVWINGSFAGEHLHSGYTPFELEITKFIDGAEIEIVVSVENASSDEAIPYEDSFDWSNDGGLIRPVEWYRTGDVRLTDVAINAEPILRSERVQAQSGAAFIQVQCHLDGPVTGAKLIWEICEESSPESGHIVLEETRDPQETVFFSKLLPKGIRYWHFDHPNLYTLKLTLYRNDVFSDEQTITFGFRKLMQLGQEWLLNGEPVRLPGMEWMPGSNPAFGMAEPRETVEKMLGLLKSANCVLTRFHWQQDDWVLDYCDRHGLLVQEEVPLWGCAPKDPETQTELWSVLKQQLTEMIHAHRNHPCIFAWGVGNELSADCWPVQQMVRRAISLAHELDPLRQANYVTNTAWICPRYDGTMSGDTLMINDYIGTWQTGLEQRDAWKNLVDAHPGRIFVPSEFGLCEPVFTGGDEERTRIFLRKMACYREIPQIAGTIEFCLNDYRTHMGEAENQSDRVRIHGSTDLTGNPKPSYYVIQKEYCPLNIQCSSSRLIVTCKNNLPSYSVRGYLLRIGDKTQHVPNLKPGQVWILLGNFKDSIISICRPDGTTAFVL